MFRYTFQSFRAFEQRAFATACKKSFATREVPKDAESGEEEGNSCRYLNGPLLSEFTDAMAAGLQDFVTSFEQLEEAADR